MQQFVVLFVVGIAAVSAHFGFHHHHGHRFGHFEPPFMANLSAEAKQEFKDVFHNSKLTIAEQHEHLAALAKKYDIEDEAAEFRDKWIAKKEEIAKNITELLPTLPEKYEELKEIFANKDQTREERNQALEEFKKENPEAARALFAIYGQFSFHHGRRFGGRYEWRHGGHRRFHGKKFEEKKDSEEVEEKTSKSSESE